MTCVYTFAGPDGQTLKLTGKPALKAYLASGGLQHLLPMRAAKAPAFKRSQVASAVASQVDEQRLEKTQQTVQNFSGPWAQNITIKTVWDINDKTVPKDVREKNAQELKDNPDAGALKGFYYGQTNEIYMIASQLNGDLDIARVLFHEALGHWGLHNLYGQGIKSVLQQIIALRKADTLAKLNELKLPKTLADARASVLKDQPSLTGAELEQAANERHEAAYLEAAEEVLADMAMDTPQIGFVQRALAAIKTWLRKNVRGFASMELSDAEIIRSFILPARAFVEKGGVRGSGMANETRFNRAPAPTTPAPTTAGLTPPEQGLLRRVQAAIQDNFNRLRQVQERISELTGQPIPERSNYYGAETNRPGRVAARLEDAKRDMTQPLMEKLAKSGHTPQELMSLLHAQHAPERNAAVARINPEMPDGGSGMMTADANAIVSKYRTNKVMLDLANQAREITKATLELKLAYGLIDIETFDALATAYKNYVPLKGDGEFGPKVKRAMGHDEREEHILENIARDYEQAVVAGEKNLARHALLSMALENPDSELWDVNVPPRGRYVAGTVFSVLKSGTEVATFTSQSQVSAFLEAKGTQAGQYEVMANGERVREFVKPLQDNEVPVYVDGLLVRMQIKDDQLAGQLRPLNADQMNPILEFMRGVNRYLSKIYTGYNPSFIIRNTARDAMTGTINMIGNEGAVTAAKAWGNYPSAMKALAVYAATGKSPTGEAGKMLEEYRQHGGKTGASYMSDLEEQGKTLQRMFDDAYGAKGYLAAGKPGKAALIAGRKIVGGMAHVIEVMNQATENGLRLALYMAMRNQGKTAGEAAQAAKSVTVDFDRKGTMTPALGAIFLFFNPAVQGTANALKTLFKGAHKGQAWAALGALAALGAYAAGQGMDDDEDRWLGEGWESRSKNFMLNIGGHTIKVPISMEFAPFYAAGVAMAEAKRNGTSKMAAAGHMVSSFIDAYFPLQGMFSSESDNHALDAAMATVPTVLKPGVQIAVNRNSFGSQIVPDNEFTKDRPDNLKMFRGTKGTAYDAAAQGIAKGGEALGSGRYENDITKVSPETLKMMWRTYTGGLGQFVTDMGGLANVAAQDGTNLETSDVPVVKDFVKVNNVNAIRGRFYELTKDARAVSEEFKQAKKAGDDQAMDDIESRPAKAELLGLDKMIKATTKAAAGIRDEMVDVNADKSLSLAEKRAQLKALEKEEEALYRDAIKAFKN